MQTMEITKHLTKRTLIVAASVAAVAVGAGAAVAKTSGIFDPKAERDAFDAAVAKKLGVTQQKLEDAYRAAALERLDAAVKDGQLTQEQANALRQRVESGDFLGPGLFLGPPGFGGSFGHHGFGPPGVGPLGGKLDAAAQYLGLTVSELATKLQSGQSLADVAKAEGKSVEGLKTAMLSDAKAKLDQAVKDGKLTDAQRDQIVAGLESRIDDLINRKGFAGPDDHFGLRFHHSFFGPQIGPGNPDDSSFGQSSLGGNPNI